MLGIMMITADVEWCVVAEVATALGVKPGTLKKWRQRGVPRDRQLDLIRQSGGRIPLHASFRPVAAKRESAA